MSGTPEAAKPTEGWVNEPKRYRWQHRKKTIPVAAGDLLLLIIPWKYHENMPDYSIAMYTTATAGTDLPKRDKETFYSQLQVFFERLNWRDLLIVAGVSNGRTMPGDKSRVDTGALDP
ncbi:unnamed protein product [Schistocephalus solidus]|uniref:Peptidase_C25 domain-containing protein n=1 Tax=Schistocephalus solidus TaxID=70667 RepID=A0A183TMH9_SCHSO|nr:unnamed protein product [Schistocephalus solidus]